MGERVAGVAASARLLLLAWLDRACGGDVLDFLDALDVETYEGSSPSLPISLPFLLLPYLPSSKLLCLCGGLYNSSPCIGRTDLTFFVLHVRLSNVHQGQKLNPVQIWQAAIQLYPPSSELAAKCRSSNVRGCPQTKLSKSTPGGLLLKLVCGHSKASVMILLDFSVPSSGMLSVSSFPIL